MGKTTPSSGKTTEVAESLVSINKIPQVESVINIKTKLKNAGLKNLLLIGSL